MPARQVDAVSNVRSAVSKPALINALRAHLSELGTGNVSVVFSSDQNGTDPQFAQFAKGANVLIMHLAIAPGVDNPLHATPAVVGRIAQEAGVGQLIVSHIGLFNLDAAIADLRKFYTGPLIVGADMQCTPVQ